MNFYGLFNHNNNDDNKDMSDFFLNFIGIILGYQNLLENRQQSAYNNINKSNQEQAKKILDDLHIQFNIQNAMLEDQNRSLEEILKILKGEK